MENTLSHDYDELISSLADLQLKDAAKVMKFDLAATENNNILLFHDRGLGYEIDYALFNADKGALTLVDTMGRQQNSGIRVHPPIANKMASAQYLYMIQTDHSGAVFAVIGVPIVPENDPLD